VFGSKYLPSDFNHPVHASSGPGAVEKVLFYPPTPQGGLTKLLDFNKSPLGDLGVSTKREDFFYSPKVLINNVITFYSF